MYILAIGYLYVILMMAITEKSLISGLLTLVFYGVIPLAIMLWLMSAPERARRRKRIAQSPATPDIPTTTIPPTTPITPTTTT